MEEAPQVLPVCQWCEEPIQADQVRAELTCHHFLHTNCLIAIAVGDGDRIRCGVCQQVAWTHPHLYEPHEAESVAGSEASTNRIFQLYTSNPRFKTLAKRIVAQNRVMTKRYNELLRFSRQKHQEIRPQLLAIQAQLEGLTGLKKNEVRTSVAFQSYQSASRSYNGLVAKMRRDYNCGVREMARNLRDVPGFRRFSPGYYRYSRNRIWSPFYFYVRV